MKDSEQLMSEARDLVRLGAASAIRRSAGMTLKDMAAALGVDLSTVSRYETGARGVTGATGERYARLLAMMKGTPDGRRQAADRHNGRRNKPAPAEKPDRDG